MTLEKSEVGSSAASPGWANWIPISEREPPIGIDVLVSDGEDVKMDHQYFCYLIDGRVLMPSDPRRATTTPVRRFAVFENVSHWMPLPLPPNVEFAGGRQAVQHNERLDSNLEKEK